MFSFLKALVGGTSYATDPVGTGVLHLRQGIKAAGLPDAHYPDALLRELSEYAYTFAQNMAMMITREQPVTYFVQHLEYIVVVLGQAANGQTPRAPEPLHNILSRYSINSQTD